MIFYIGVEKVEADTEIGTLTITGNFNGIKLRDSLANEINKKIIIISPLPKKDKEVISFYSF